MHLHRTWTCGHMLHGQRFGILLAFLWLAAAARICVEPWAGLVARYASLSSSDWRRRRGFPLQAFSMMLQHSECMLHSRPYQHMLWAAGDDRIRCSYLLRFSVYRIWIGWDWIWTPLYCTSSLLPCCLALCPCAWLELLLYFFGGQ